MASSQRESTHGSDPLGHATQIQHDEDSQSDNVADSSISYSLQTKSLQQNISGAGGTSGSTDTETFKGMGINGSQLYPVYHVVFYCYVYLNTKLTCNIR